MTGKERVASRIARRHGAWLISATETTSGWGIAESHNLFDCASSEPAARRVARRIAEELGWTGPFHWHHRPEMGGWELTATDDIAEEDA